MNIFAVSENPYLAARDLCDKHCVKMILESCQLLCTWLFVNHPEVYEENKQKLYRPTHVNHPCSKWLRESDSNVWWLLSHTEELILEYYKRYNKIHACRQMWLTLISLCSGLIAEEDQVIGRPTPFKQCMPDQYKNPSAVLAYRSYMIGEKTRFAKWKLGNKPEWWNSNV